MKIRTKLFFSFIFIAVLSAVLATFFAIYSISGKYRSFAAKETISTKKDIENLFYEYLGELTRKSVFISELSEVVNNINNPDDLLAILGNKSFFLHNINIKIIDPGLKIIASHNYSNISYINQEDLSDIPFFNKERDYLLRDAGVFKIKNNICILVVSPIIDQDSFSFKGYLLFELNLNSEFVDQLKERTKGDIVIMSGMEKLASTFQDEEGNRFFPKVLLSPDEETHKLKILNENFLISSFTIFDYFKHKIGEVFIAVNIEDIILARKHGILNLVIVFVIVVIIVIIISLFTGKKLTNSILHLSRGAETLSKGEFDVRIEPTSNDEIGQLTHIFNNMTESLKVQRDEILDLKLFFEKIIENSPSAIIICNIISHGITVNPAAEKLFSIKAKDIEGKEIFEVINLPLSLQADFYQVILNGIPISHNSYRVFFPKDEERIFRLSFYKVALQKEITIAIQIEDITKSYKLEENLIHAQKLGTLGAVLGRFTHELNNLMTGILGNIDLLKRTVKKNSKHYQRILIIDDLASKAHELGGNILSFSKKEKLRTEKTDVGKLIESVLNLVENTVFKNINIRRDYSDGPFFAKTNKEKLSLALLNLLINSRDAIKETAQKVGIIVISIDYLENEQKDGRFLRIRVSDNGKGIDKKIIDRIFEPYFTTKGKKGTGLGLATVKDIVEKCNGTITVDSLPDKGTSFSLQFPKA